MRALVIDAVPDVAATAHLTLDAGGWEVLVARDEPAAILALETSHVDLVILDLGLPDIEPMGLVMRLRDGRPNLSILVLAAGPGTGQGVAALFAGADDFLTKPYSQHEMIGRLGAAARRRVRSHTSRARLQEVITGVTSEVTDAVIITTADQRIQSFNTAAEHLYGFKVSEVLGHPTTEVLRWVGAETTFEAARVELAEAGAWHGVAEQYRRDGSIVCVRSSTQRLEDDEGKLLGFISVNRPFEAGRSDEERQDFQLAQDEIARGLAADEFVVHYQPLVRIEDRAIIGVEALARWQHGDELLRPAEFIPAAEETDLILEIGAVVLHKACEQLAAWRTAGHDLHLTVNLSARQLLDPGLVGLLDDCLRRAALPQGAVTLEVTETSLIHDVAAATKVLLQVADLGIGVSIDDFGTGWASLTYLQQLPVTCLKIDRSFVTRLGVDHRDTAIVRSIIALGHELDLIVIAEGVETEAQLEALQTLGCRYAQGFLLAKPMPSTDLAL